MVYDYQTDIENLTRNDSLSTTLVDWAVDMAKTFYIADDPANYDDDLSLVDNRLVSMLAAGFIGLHLGGFMFGSEFTLDELTIKENNESSEQQKFFDLFFKFLRLYQARGVTLAYVDTAGVMLVSEYDPTLYIIDRDSPAGLET